MNSQYVILQNIANQTVLIACRDYRKALRGEGYKPKSPEAVIKEVEKFFLSPRFKLFTKISGKYLLAELRKEYEDERKSNSSNAETD